MAGPLFAAPAAPTTDAELAAKYGRALEILEEERFDEAATVLLTLADRNPWWTGKDKALFNAAVAYEGAGRWDRASEVYHKLIAETPGSPLAPQALHRTGFIAERAGDLELALHRYSSVIGRYAALPSAKSIVAQSALDAAKVVEKAGNHARAAKLYLDFARRWPGHAEAPGALARAGEAFETAGAWNAAAAAWRGYVKRAPDAAGVVRGWTHVGSALAKTGKVAPARLAFVAAVRAFDSASLTRGGEAAEHAARAAFWLVEESRERRYDKLAIEVASLAALVPKVKAKAKVLGALETKYEEIARFGVPTWTLAAVYRIGFMYEYFMDPILATPPYVSRCPAAGGAYCKALASYRDRAASHYETVLGEARKISMRNEWTGRAWSGLQRLRPGEYVDPPGS